MLACRDRVTGVLSSALLVAVAMGPAVAQDIQPGFNLFQTLPGTTFLDFSTQPIPAGFFFPGSDPFSGTINFAGFPAGSSADCPDDDLSLVDTIFERLGPSSHPTFPSTDVVQIEIVKFSLISASPFFVVTANGGQDPRPMAAAVTLSKQPQTSGQMQIVRTHENGGVFTASLPVLPLLSFFEPPPALGAVVILDFGLEGRSPINFQVVDIPWEYGDPPSQSCTSNFCVNEANLTLLQAAQAEHGVIAICPTFSVVPVAPTSWTLMKSRWQ